jgi:hypothetical protein
MGAQAASAPCREHQKAKKGKGCLGDMIEALEYLNRRHRKIKPK